jgi:TP901 family phage tail tape measure protein
MSAQLEAAMKLRLEDLLSAPLKKIEEMLDRIAAVGKLINFDKLNAGLAPLNAGAEAAQKVADQLKQVGDQATAAVPGLDEVTSALDAMTDQATSVASVAGEIEGVGSAASTSAAGVARLADALARASRAADGLRGAGVINVSGAGAASYGAPHSLVPQAAPGSPENPWSNVGDAAEGAGFGAALRRGAHKGAMEPFMGFLAAASIFEGIKSYSEFEQGLRQTAITEHLSGKQVDPEEARLTKLFDTDALRTGQSSKNISEAYRELVQMGISSKLIDRVIGMHSEVATAYGISATDLGPVAGALLKNMGIGDKDFGGAMAAIAESAKHGRFKMTDFSTLFSGVSAQFANVGVTGRSGVNYAAAALETVMTNSSQPGQAAQDLQDLLRYIYQPREDTALNKVLHVDLKKYMHAHTLHGENPLAVYLNLLKGRFKGLNPNDASQLSNELLKNSQAQGAALALIMHGKDFQAQIDDNAGQNQGSLDKDFKTASQGTEFQLNVMHEKLVQISRTFGQSFFPAIQIANVGLSALNDGLTWANTHFPLLTHLVIGGAGALLALSVALGVVGFLSGPLAAVFSPIGLIIAGVIAAVALLGFGAYELITHWQAVKAFFSGLWEGVKSDFEAFGSWIEGWIAGPVGRALSLFTAARGGSFGAGPAAMPAGAGTATIHHDIHVHVTTDSPQTRASATVTTRGSTAAPNRGPMLSRP